MPLLPGTVAKQIESQAANLNDLVIEAYRVCFFCKGFFMLIHMFGLKLGYSRVPKRVKYSTPVGLLYIAFFEIPSPRSIPGEHSK